MHFEIFIDPHLLGFKNSVYSDVRRMDSMKSGVVLCDIYLSIKIIMLTLSLFTYTNFIKSILVERLRSKHSVYRIYFLYHIVIIVFFKNKAIKGK